MTAYVEGFNGALTEKMSVKERPSFAPIFLGVDERPTAQVTLMSRLVRGNKENGTYRTGITTVPYGPVSSFTKPASMSMKRLPNILELPISYGLGVSEFGTY